MTAVDLEWVPVKPGSVIYLSGPMAGREDLNKAAFETLRFLLRGCGYEVACPWEKSSVALEDPRHVHMRRDINDVLNSDAVMVLDEWQKSPGARLETAVALEVNIPVYTIDWVEITCDDHPWFQSDLAQVQHEVYDWQKRNFPTTTESHIPLLGVFEEMGELVHAHIKGFQGIRHTPEKIAAMKKDAIGDVLIYLCDYANKEGISLAECLHRTWAEVSKRDWIANPTTGVALTEESNG